MSRIGKERALVLLFRFRAEDESPLTGRHVWQHRQAMRTKVRQKFCLPLGSRAKRPEAGRSGAPPGRKARCDADAGSARFWPPSLPPSVLHCPASRHAIRRDPRRSADSNQAASFSLYLSNPRPILTSTFFIIFLAPGTNSVALVSQLRSHLCVNSLRLCIIIRITGSCHKRQKAQAPTPRAPIRNRQTRKVANAKVLNRNTNLT